MTRKLMKKAALLSGVAALALGIGAVPAFAATTDTSSSASDSSSSGPTSQTTTTTAEFDTSPNATIALDSAPNIGFGANATPNGKLDMTYNATTADNPVEVSNPGLPSGWNVQVKNTPFTDAAGDTLKGAVLSLGEPDIAAANTGNPSTAPTASAFKLDGTGTNAVVYNAVAKGGLGIWDANYGLAEISLAVPSGQLGGTYTSTMTWQLNDTPQ
ncbi:WxL domain-containing protein [Levilactobacillus fuyuanensis]|uniref:WxL domain-containing protein n=1 Tax=Levilactobacillus fuyuanensis TaxID=2486022 RepID=A0ABW4H1G9_9LACO|nr:WxL domain-containing protein [Levilactobacillus fuyuanensis]